ncbi:hypothetical protein A6B34_00870 [Mycolicibacterium monacense]|nr:hypothetical protein A6B34_00870 [Mycolicibacterium monacense]OBF53993.1 hypothetical protein A5778_11510 [Mycolicibacterium monacense]ORB16413.1 hypothetical protein BST34_19895 [Mycolicibacterium monacense DSM 44395]
MAVSCQGPRSRWSQQHEAPPTGRLARRWIAAALLLALGLAALALVVADPAAAHLPGIADV